MTHPPTGSTVKKAPPGCTSADEEHHGSRVDGWASGGALSLGAASFGSPEGSPVAGNLQVIYITMEYIYIWDIPIYGYIPMG